VTRASCKEYCRSIAKAMRTSKIWQVPCRADERPNNLKSASVGSGEMESVFNRIYTLERATNPSGSRAFIALATNIPGQSGLATFTDTNAIGAGPCSTK